MKTVKDVYTVYKEWPHENMYFVSISSNNAINFMEKDCGEVIPCDIGVKVYTREQYEQYKAEQENPCNFQSFIDTTNNFVKQIEEITGGKNMKTDWYDYDKGELIKDNKPVQNEEIEAVNDNSFVKANYATTINNGSFDIHLCYSLGEEAWFSADIRPLDHDKYTVKTAPLEWMIECGLDAEFSDPHSGWAVAKLTGIGDKFTDDNNDSWTYCRPRMNHLHVLTRDQHDMIPDCFEIDVKFQYRNDAGSAMRVIEFKGLKQGYKYEYDK